MYFKDLFEDILEMNHEMQTFYTFVKIFMKGKHFALL